MNDLQRRLIEAKGDRGIDAIAAQASSAGYPLDRATVARYLAGGGSKRPTERILMGLAAGLGLDVTELRALTRRPSGEREPYRPPIESNRLDMRQRRALDELIRAVAQPTERQPDFFYEDPETGSYVVVEVKGSGSLDEADAIRALLEDALREADDVPSDEWQREEIEPTIAQLRKARPEIFAPAPDSMAARTGTPARRTEDEHLKSVGEESQDTGSDESS